MESDSSTAIAWTRGKGCLPWHCLRDRVELSSLLPTFVDWKISHVLREGNQMADHLAGQRVCPGSSLIDAQHTWQYLQELLDQDAQGATHLRVKKDDLVLIDIRQAIAVDTYNMLYAINKEDGRYYTVLEGGLQNIMVHDESFMDAQIEAASEE
ncbi:hypothetical protein QJS10_CPA03g01359 [Acorus calamus]|uniref:RNase H type-1 domain-containing protein n=1 Tax=Acorus calamus TaxID=4465 RepID=A0AAV9F4G1_ACOCL|nr:hypothetical protein QJS10_CPA03g01359 [Acorus calamus]